MLMGEYHHSIDNKGRLIIPSKFRYELGESFIITRGLEKCLFIYKKSKWDDITNKLNTLPFTKKDARSFMRFFLSGACICDTDKQGRINIPQNLIDYATISKECVVIGVLDRLEVWSLSEWNEFCSKNNDNLSDIAENLFDSNCEDGE